MNRVLHGMVAVVSIHTWPIRVLRTRRFSNDAIRFYCNASHYDPTVVAGARDAAAMAFAARSYSASHLAYPSWLSGASFLPTVWLEGIQAPRVLTRFSAVKTMSFLTLAPNVQLMCKRAISFVCLHLEEVATARMMITIWAAKRTRPTPSHSWKGDPSSNFARSRSQLDDLPCIA